MDLEKIPKQNLWWSKISFTQADLGQPFDMIFNVWNIMNTMKSKNNMKHWDNRKLNIIFIR